MSRKDFDYPSGTPLVAEDSRLLTAPWGQWIQRIHTAVQSMQQSGPTSERPTRVLWIGRRYFDTTLGLPVWVGGGPPAPAPAVWVSAAGVPT
jgi:hypothetical protein